MIFRIFSYLAYMASRDLFLILLLIFFRFRVEGRENLPKKGPFIFASNHVSYLDPGVLGGASTRRLYFITGDHLYKNIFAAAWYNSTGCIRIRRNEADHHAIRKILDCLKKGKPVAMFPEGTRSPDGKMQDAFTGIGFLALKANVPVVPCLIKGSERAFGRHDKFFRFTGVKAYIGKPIQPIEARSGSDKKEARRVFSTTVMEAIVSLDR